MNSTYHPNHSEIQSFSASKNPQTTVKIKKQTSPQLLKRSQPNHRIINPKSNNSICFISPKKIAYFEKIDQSCLGASEIKIISQQSNGKDDHALKLALNQKSMQIDYQSIKRCLSPRVYQSREDASSRNSEKVDRQKINKYIEKQSAEQADIQFYRKLVNDLKQEVLEMSSIIQAKDKQIRQKDARIVELQREGFREQISDIHSQSLKELSTNFEERSSRLIQSFTYLNDDDKNDKIAQMEETLQIYESTIKKQQIEISIYKKYKFDRVQMQGDLHSITKKHSSLKRKVDRLVEKNLRLNKQLQKMRHEVSNCNQRSFILEYSPQKPFNLS